MVPSSFEEAVIDNVVKFQEVAILQIQQQKDIKVQQLGVIKAEADAEITKINANVRETFEMP